MLITGWVYSLSEVVEVICVELDIFFFVLANIICHCCVCDS